MPAPKHIGSHVNALSRKVAFEDLKMNPENEREYDRNDEAMVRQRQSLKANGVLTEFQIYEDGTVHDGNSRLFNIGILVEDGEWEHGAIPSRIVARPETRAEGVIARLNINEANQFSPLAQGDAFAKLREDGLNNKEISDKTPFSAMHVGNMLTLHDAAPDIRDFVRNRSISATLVIETIRKHDEQLIRDAVAEAFSKGKDKATQRHVDDVLWNRSEPSKGDDAAEEPVEDATAAPPASTAPWEGEDELDGVLDADDASGGQEEEEIKDADEDTSLANDRPTSPKAASENEVKDADQPSPTKEGPKARAVIKDVAPTIRALLDAISGGTKTEKLEILTESADALSEFMEKIAAMGLDG